MSLLSQSSDDAPACAPAATDAWLILDGQGGIIAASSTAAGWWRSGPDLLKGRPVSRLFRLEVVSSEPAWEATQWEALRDAASAGRALSLMAQPAEGDSFPVRISLEEGSAGAAYLARLSRAVAAPPATPAPPEQSTRDERLIRDGPVGFFEFDFAHQRAWFSPTWKRQLGYADSELDNTQETWQKLIHPEDSEATPEQPLAARPGTCPFSIEYRMRHKEGHYLWFLSSGVQVFDDAGVLLGSFGVQLEIQERKELEDAGILSHERLRLLTTRAGLPAFDLDFADGSSWLSPALKGLLGYKEGDLNGPANPMEGLIDSTEKKGSLEEFFLAHTSSGNTPADFGLRLRHAEGHFLALQASVSTFVSRSGTLLRVLGHLRLPAGEISLGSVRLPGSHLREALDRLAEGVLMADAQGRVLYLNRQAEKLTQISLEQALGKPAAETFRAVSRSTLEPVENPVEHALTMNEPTGLSTEFALLAGADEVVPIAFQCAPVRNEQNRLAGAVLIFRNPDEMTLTPEELIKSNRFESLGVLAGGIAHDFNNLLTTILGGISLAKDNKDYTGLDDGEQGCVAAKSLSKQLLTFAKGSGSSRQVLSLNNVLRESARLAAAGSAIPVEIEAAGDLYPVQVNQAQIGQVFQNLIINAIQAMSGKGKIWIRARNTVLKENQVEPLPPGDYAQVEVQDNGSGISPENLQKIFDPFFTTKKTGTGLGLATVLSIVKNHGGQIGLASELGVGTTFTIFLPKADKPMEEEARRAPTLRFGTGRILFMDDDSKISFLTGNMLQSLDYKYDLAKNGDEALTLYKRYLNIGRPYDAVIMDITVIGGMGAEETFAKLIELDPEVRAIVSSGYDNDEMIRKFLEMGFCGYLTKPYRVAELGKILKTVLGN